MFLPNRPNRYFILLCAFLMQLCLGATYSWSVFVGPLREITGLGQGAAQTPFTIFYFAFPATTVLAGILLPRLGPRRSAMVGGILFGGGWMLASLGGENFLFTVVGIGLLAGTGVGFAYIVPIAIGVQWFPERKGLVTGIAVAGFGGGAALVSQIAGRLMIGGFASPFHLFFIFGVVFFLVVFLSGSMMRFADAMKSGRPVRLGIRIIVERPEFRRLYAAMVTALAVGFVVNANLREFSPVGALETGVAAVTLFAVTNALGRVLWGMLFDLLSDVVTLRLNLLCQAAVLWAGIWFVQSPAGLLLFAALAGFNYGGVLVIYPSTVARVYGSEHLGEVYGLLFSANIVAAPTAVLSGLVFDWFGTFLPVTALLGLFLTVMAWGVGGIRVSGRG